MPARLKLGACTEGGCMKRKTPQQQLGPLFTIEDQDCGPLGHAYEKHGRFHVIDRDGGYVGQVPLGSLAAARTMLRQHGKAHGEGRLHS